MLFTTAATATPPEELSTTSQVVAEALGMSLTHSALAPSGHPIWIDMARRSARAALLLESRSLDRGYFQRASIERLFDEHRAKHRDNYDRIWRLLNLELWHRVCLEGEPNSKLAEPETRVVSTH